MLRPRVSAVLRLMTSSNVVGSATGKSPGLVPLRIRFSCEATQFDKPLIDVDDWQPAFGRQVRNLGAVCG